MRRTLSGALLDRLVRPRLTRAARRILATERPFVVGVAGSVGKTAAKDAIACVLDDWKRTRSTIGNQNDEFGVPLSIVGRTPSGRNPFGWLASLRHADRLAMSPPGSYPDCLVLELGSCHAGDVEYLVDLVEPALGVLTGIELSHLETYGSLEAIELEERKVVTLLEPGSTAVVNIDSEGARRAIDVTRCPVVTFGFGNDADVRGEDVVSTIDWSTSTATVRVHVRSGDARATLRFEHLVGRHSCYAPLAAIGVARAVGISLDGAARALTGYTPPPGRMSCRRSDSGAVIVDDTYNASPAATCAALETLATLEPRTPVNRRLAVLGSMAELGSASAAEHMTIGRLSHERSIDAVIAVGRFAEATARGALEAGMAPDAVIAVSCGTEAVTEVRRRARSGDIVLVKGSRSSKLEAVVEALGV